MTLPFFLWMVFFLISAHNTIYFYTSDFPRGYKVWKCKPSFVTHLRSDRSIPLFILTESQLLRLPPADVNSFFGVGAGRRGQCSLSWPASYGSSQWYSLRRYELLQIDYSEPILWNTNVVVFAFGPWSLYFGKGSRFLTPRSLKVKIKMCLFLVFQQNLIFY